MFRDNLFKIIRMIPWVGKKKYFLAAFIYMTPKKILNIIRCEFDAYRKTIYPKSQPYIIILDIANFCNLRCTYCPTGAGKQSGRKTMSMSLELVDQILDEIGDKLVIAYLYNWGEPLLNKNVGAIVRAFHKRGIFTSLSSNLSLRCKDRLEDICDAGLDHLDPSIDGATQEVYQKYRKGGDLQLALDNIKYLAEYRKKRNRVNPVIDWQFLEFDHNIHEVNQAKNIAKKVGADRFFTRHGNTPADKETKTYHKKKKPSCKLLYRSLVINADYTVAPCCYVYKKENDFGDLHTDSIRNIRNNDKYVTGRKLFSDSYLNNLDMESEHPCFSCYKNHR